MSARFPPARSAVLNCPGCGTKVAADASICPKCDYIIDTSFLGSLDVPAEANDDEADAAENTPPPRPSRPAAPAARPARPAASASPRAAPSRPARPAAAKPAPRRAPEPEPEPEEPPEEDWRPKRTEPAPAPRGQSSGPPRERDASFTSPDEAIHEARAFVEGLTKSDKLAAGGVALLVVSLFLPWRETAADGDELGIVTSGFLAALLGLGVLGAIFARLRKPLPNLNIPDIVPWAAQAALAALTVILCFVFLTSAYDGTLVPANVGNGTMRASTPSLGAIIGLAGAVVGAVGTALGFMGKQA